MDSLYDSHSLTPCDARDMSESLRATLIQDDDKEFEEAVAPYVHDSLLERAITTGWKCYEKGGRRMVATAMDY